MSSRDILLEQLGYPLDRTTPEGTLVEALVIDGNTIYASGQVPFDGDRLMYQGKAPSQVSMVDATAAAALGAANVLRAVRKAVGSLDHIERGLCEMVEHAGLEEAFVGKWRDNYQSTQEFDSWPTCDSVVESIDEDPAAKQPVFDQLERVVGSDVPIGSNTAAIPITLLQQGRQQADELFHAHAWQARALMDKYFPIKEW